jgi:2-polyprenyl-3-methyl-5-hydroxy-6-metoxy-1,4-benzoquinol methylase
VSTLKPDNQKQVGKDDWSEHWQAYAKSASENPAQKMRHNIVLKRLLNLSKKPELLLDIGSGQGDFLYKAVISQSAKKYVGFELSETGVSISRSKVPQAEFIQVNLFSPPDNISRFIGQGNVAICSDVIEHVDEPEEFCRLLKDYLKPDGYLFLTVPGGPMSDFDRHIGHRTHYNQATITQLLIAAGFNVEKVYLAGFPFFNLYRLMVILRGKRLILDVETNTDGSPSGLLASLMMRIFRILFKLNLGHSRFGWQIFAVARRPI